MKRIPGFSEGYGVFRSRIFPDSEALYRDPVEHGLPIEYKRASVGFIALDGGSTVETS